MATANLLQTSVSGGTQNALSLQGDGVFFPKASTTSRLALTLTTTDKGFIVYDTTDNNIYFWNGAAWESVPSSGDAGANGSVQYNDNGIVSGASNFTYDKATSAVSIAGALTLTGGTANGVPYLNASKVVTTGSNLSFANTPGFFDTTLNINSLLGSALYRGGITVAEDNVGFTLFGGSGYKLIQTSGFSTPNQLSFYASNAEQYRIGASGVFTWLDGAGGTRMTLNSTGLGIGMSPSYKLEVVAPAGDNIVSLFRSGDATAANNAGGGFRSISSATAASRVAQVWLDADGADFSSGDYFFIQKNGNSGTVEFNQSSNAAMTFLTNGTERARIDASGNLILQSSATPATLGTNGMLTVNATSNTNLRFSYRGSDGTTRVANITLA